MATCGQGIVMRTIGKCLVAVIAMAFALGLSPAHADKRVALVVGNSAYVNVPRLANPANDARLMADTLRVAGLYAGRAAARSSISTSPDFDRAVQDFGDQLQGADVGCSTTPAMACRCTAPTIWCRSAPIRPRRPMSICRCSTAT